MCIYIPGRGGRSVGGFSGTCGLDGFGDTILTARGMAGGCGELILGGFGLGMFGIPASCCGCTCGPLVCSIVAVIVS